MTNEDAIKFANRLKNNYTIDFNDMADFCNMAIKALEQQPCDDCVSLGVYKQVIWERDIAIEQLRELGYGFGEKIRTSEDCVSRKAILEMIEQIQDAGGFIGYNTYSEALYQVNNMSSVTPKLPTSDDCVSRAEVNKLYDEYRPRLATHVSEFGDKLKALPPVTPTQSWIPVSSERLPKEGEMVSITTEDLYLAKLNPCYGWRNGNYWYTFTANGSYLIKYPIAWQPLPKPYEDKWGNKVGWSSLENVREKVERGNEK